MAEIATYRCSNARCLLTVRLCREFPVWRADAPRGVRALSITERNRPYVERFRSEALCRCCRTVVADARDGSCPRCNAALSGDQTGKACLQCSEGAFLMIHLSVR